MEILSQLNSPAMYLLCGAIILFVALVCVFFMIRAYRAGVAIGMDKTKMKRTITASATFAALPSVGILLGVIALSGSLGTPWSWLRLSVIGALQYETQMADGAAKAITGSTDGLTLLIQRGVTAQDYATIVTLMTVAIIAGPILVVLFYKKLQPKLAKLGAMKVGGAVDPDTATKNLESDAKKANPNGINLGDLAFQVSFIGMIIGYIAMSIGAIAAMPGRITSYYNFIAVIVAALFMVLSDFLVKKLNWKWLDDFSVAFSMLFAMLIVGIISGTTGQF